MAEYSHRLQRYALDTHRARLIVLSSTPPRLVVCPSATDSNRVGALHDGRAAQFSTATHLDMFTRKNKHDACTWLQK